MPVAGTLPLQPVPLYLVCLAALGVLGWQRGERRWAGAGAGLVDPASLSFLLGLEERTDDPSSGVHSALTPCVNLDVLSPFWVQ